MTWWSSSYSKKLLDRAFQMLSKASHSMRTKTSDRCRFCCCKAYPMALRDANSSRMSMEALNQMQTSQMGLEVSQQSQRRSTMTRHSSARSHAWASSVSLPRRLLSWPVMSATLSHSCLSQAKQVSLLCQILRTKNSRSQSRTRKTSTISRLSKRQRPRQLRSASRNERQN